jgi:hypothetical protein
MNADVDTMRLKPRAWILDYCQNGIQTGASVSMAESHRRGGKGPQGECPGGIKQDFSDELFTRKIVWHPYI